MAIQGISGMVQSAIQRAAQATGVDFSFLMKTANRESGFNPAAKSGVSSAAGLFQFVGVGDEVILLGVQWQGECQRQ